MRNKQQQGVLSFWKKVAFGSGGMGDNLMQSAVNNMANPVLNICLGVNPALVSSAIFIARLWDAFTDPVMGSISDNTSTRFGRRRPYILIGGATSAAVFILLWRFPFVDTEIGYFFWFLGCTLLFYTCYTVFSVPYNALSYELSTDYNERTRIMAFKCIFAAMAGLAIQWQFKLTQLSCFKNTLDGMAAVSLGIAFVILVTTMAPAFFSKERTSVEVSRRQKIRLLASLQMTLRNRTFCLLMLTLIFVCLGLYMVSQLGLYLNVYYVFGGDKKQAATMMGIAGSTYHILGGILAAPVISFFAGRIGKKKTLMCGLVLAICGSTLKFITYNPNWPYLQLLSLALMSPGLSSLWVLAPSMVADICDLDELENGTRREGMFGAVYGYVMKIGLSIGLLLVGFILNSTGFKAELGAKQTAQTIMMLRVLYTLIPTVGLLAGLLLISRFPITPEKARAVRLALDARQKSIVDARKHGAHYKEEIK